VDRLETLWLVLGGAGFMGLVAWGVRSLFGWNFEVSRARKVWMWLATHPLVSLGLLGLAFAIHLLTDPD
jgi:hypothetical protein